MISINRLIGSLASGWVWPLKNTIKSEGGRRGRSGHVFLWLLPCRVEVGRSQKVPTKDHGSCHMAFPIQLSLTQDSEIILYSGPEDLRVVVNFC